MEADAAAEQSAALQQRLDILRRRQRLLEAQRAHYGAGAAPPHILLELEDIAHDLARCQADLRRLHTGPTDARPPYLGLSTFQESNADLFFGRDALITDLVERAGHAPFLAVLGASGSGKSSVVRAGLIPMLKSGSLPGSGSWPYFTFKPAARPLDTLAAELAKLQGGDLGAVLALSRQLAETDRALLLAADLLVDRASGQRLVLVVDQFEELWTLQATEPEQHAASLAQQQAPFIQLLLTAVAAPDTPLLVVLSMRADFLHRAAEHPALASAIAEHDVIVSPMTSTELRDAIVRPAELAGGSFEAGLVDELIAQTSGREGALPLLEYTLLELWKQRQTDGIMTWEDYKTIGRVEGALAARADAILHAQYTPEQQDALRQVLLRLVQPGEGATETRRRVRLDDVVPVGESLDALHALLKPLTDERLLTTGRDSVTGYEIVEVTHEALIRAWPRLANWIAEARADLRLQLQLEDAAREWQASGQNADLLWSGLRLSSAEAWLERAHPRLTARDLAFLDASREDEQRRAEEAVVAARDRQRLQEEQRNARRLRRFLLAVGVMLAVALGAGVVALRSRQDAQQARDQSQQLAWAGESLFELQRAPERSLILALAAQPTDLAARSEPMAARALFSAFDEAGIHQVLRGHTASASTVAWSPDGTYLLTGSDDQTAQVWDAATGAEARVLRGHTEGILAVACSPDGKSILTGGEDRTARVRDAATGAEVRVLRGHTANVTAVAWSPDGKYLLTGSVDATARVWDAAIGAEVRVLHGHTEGILAVAWSPDSTHMLTGGYDFTARVWDAATGAEVRVLEGHSDDVWAVAWSPDGKYVLTGSTDQTIRVWEVASGAEVRVLRGHTGVVLAVAWSPSGKYLLTGSGDATVCVWDAATGAEVRVLHGHAAAVTAVA